MADYKSLTKALSAELLRRECKLSERQIMLLRWNQIEDGKLVTRQREVELSEVLVKALESLPCSDRYVFGRSPLLPPEETEGKTHHHFLIFKR